MRLPFMFSGAQGMFLSRMAAHSGWRTSIFPIPPGRIPLVWYSGYMKGDPFPSVADPRLQKAGAE